jgi:UDP-N-acetylmuramoylalanine--D-glutamate ligase
LAVLNADNQISSSFAHLTPAQVYYFSRQKKVKGAYVKNKKIYLLDKEIGFTSKLQLLGKHNWDNICAAVTASWLVGADLKSIKKVIFSFQGLEHRLEFVKEVKGRVFYNDSFSTTPETTIAALHSFHQPLTLIAGGSEKGSDYQKLGEEIKRSRVKTLILIGEMAEKIRKAVLAAGFKGEIIFRPSKKMSAIVNLSFRKTKRGGVILLSPACASFDMFKNYKDRGLQFKRNVKRLS